MTKLTIAKLAANFAIGILVAGLAGCSSTPEDDSQTNTDSRARDSLFSSEKNYTRRQLELPPDLLATANDKVRENYTAAEAGGELRVLPKVIGATIRTDDANSWLEIDADAEVVWRKLTEFWAAQEIKLVQYRPQAGFMETDWFAKTAAGGGRGFGEIAAELVAALVARTARDKFTIRLQRNDAGGTLLFAAHRRKEKIVRANNSPKNSEVEWVEREQDPEKIAQLLQTLVLLFDAAAEPEPA